MADLLVKLQIYEGPLDLLLHLIKKNEVDLDDIPVALVTAQYLEYLDLMESLNVELAADFLVMAATLTQIKSRLLLPQEESEDQEGNPADDLKAAIIDPLLEHLRRGLGDYREAAEALSSRQLLDADVFVRGGQPFVEEESEPEAGDLAPVTLFDLVDAFRSLADKKADKKTMSFVVESKTIGQRIREVQEALLDRKRLLFQDLCRDDKSQPELVLSFLAILELARTGFLRLYQNLNKGLDLTLFLADPDAELSDLESLDY